MSTQSFMTPSHADAWRGRSGSPDGDPRDTTLSAPVSPASAAPPIAACASSHPPDAGERFTYLLEYGQDLVARLTELAPPIAAFLAATLRYLEANRALLLNGGDTERLMQLTADLDAIFAPGEWLLREVKA